ncbi:MAG: glucose-6-phosphate isomerase, partial [Gammaproteobacteria bacterium]
PNYIQQADMESNGKYVTRNSAFADYATGPIIFGEQGCDSQHSFFQLLHQGPHLVPIDFILVAKSPHFQQNQDILVASGLSQAQAFMRGKSYQEALDELQANGNSDLTAEPLARHKSIPGNRPSNTFFIEKITPRSLGMLIAIYEHKIFVQGVLWDINSFDQWGVELGKQLLPEILADLKGSDHASRHDSSTAGLIQFYLNSRNSL